MHMKEQFKEYLNLKLNPLFFIAVCIAILVFSIGAHAAIRQIAVEADKGAEVLSASRNVH